jgi:hypothetical protein
MADHKKTTGSGVLPGRLKSSHPESRKLINNRELLDYKEGFEWNKNLFVCT